MALKSTAHGRFSSAVCGTQLRRFFSFKDSLRDSTCLILETVSERQKSSSLGTAHGRFLSLKDRKNKNKKSSSLTGKSAVCGGLNCCKDNVYVLWRQSVYALEQVTY